MLIAALAVASTSPATGFESSIYESTPLFFWVFLLASLFIGVFTLIYQAFHDDKRRIWLVAFLLVMLANFSLFVLPGLRGYEFIGKADALTHIGFTMDIIQDGQLAMDDFYPITHILVAQCKEILGISIFDVGLYLPGFFTILFMLFSLLLVMAITRSKGKILLVTACSVIVLPVGAGAIFPEIHCAGLFTLFFPFALGLYFLSLQAKNNRFGFAVAFLLLMIFFAFVHQLVTLSLILMLSFIEITKHFLKRPGYLVLKNGEALHGPSQIAPILVLFIVSLAWVMNYSLFAGEAEESFKFLRGELLEVTASAHVESRLSELDIRGFDLIVLYLKMYGDKLIFGLLSLLYSIFVLREFIKKRSYRFGEMALLVACIPIGFLILATLGRHRVAAPFREIGLGMTILTVLGGMGLFMMAKQYLNSKLRMATAMLIVMVTIPISMMTTYHSSYYHAASHHATQRDLAGFQWVFESMPHRDMGIIHMDATSPYRFGNALYGTEAKVGRGGNIDIGDINTPKEWKSVYVRNDYFVLTERDRIVHSDVWEDVSKESFYNLRFAPSLDKVYWSDQFEMWCL